MFPPNSEDVINRTEEDYDALISGNLWETLSLSMNWLVLRLESLYIKNALIIDCLKKNRERVHQSEERQTKSDTPTSHHFSYKGKLSLFKIISTCKSVN